MNLRSERTEKFRKAYLSLPPNVRRQAQRAYRLFQRNPQHPGLRFKRVHQTRPIYSVRINDDYRAVGVLNDDVIIWFWIRSHTDYDKLLKKL
jgi:mRNA-degrading endonuclease RelE of RelBE toxin-antitoxin system